MDTKNSKIYRTFLSLVVVFLLAGLASFWPVSNAQAACDKAGQNFCNGQYVMQYITRFGSCNSKIIETCTYGCSNGACNGAPTCTPNCSGDQCGQSNGCGGTCGSGDKNSCGKCGNASCCTPNCNAGQCGQANGCGGTCGSSEKNSCGKCGNASCCTPNCSGKACGSDGCGGSCGSCNSPATCNASNQCTCVVRSLCTDSTNLYTRNADCSTNNTTCAYGCANNACNTCTPANGACGNNATNWPSGSTYYTGSFCNSGSASPASPAFPAQGGSTTWTCSGNSCGSAASCTATRDAVFNYSLSNSGGVSVVRGGSNPPNSGANTITASKSAGAGSAVSFSISGLPANATSSFSPTSCTPNNTCTSTLTIYAPGTVAAGSYGITVTGAPLSKTTSFTLTVNDPTVNGACGTAAKTYNATDAAYSGTYCSSGTSATPAFPASGGSTSWTCAGSGPSHSDATCTASRKLATPSISVSPSIQAASGSVLFTWGAISNATYYQIQYRRDGNWGGWSNIGTVAQQNYSMSGLTNNIVAQVQACNLAAPCSDISNQATANIAPAPTANLQATSSNIGYNAATNLYWSSSNATSCSVSPGSFSTVTNMPPPGQSTGALLSSQTYTLSCNGAGGGGTSQVTVNVAAPTLSVSNFTATPSSGTAPVNGVDFTVNVGGNAIGNIQYQIDCTNDGFYELDVISASNPYAAINLCDYPNGGSYTARAVARRSGQTANATTALNIAYAPVTVDIKAAIGQATPADGLNAPVGGSYTLSWTTTGNATACKTGVGGSWAQPNQSLPLAGGAGSTARTMTSSTETYPITCSNPGGSGTDNITIRPVPVAPPNLRITSTAPYIKGNTITFAWDAPPAASYYVVTYYLNGVASTPATSPSPAYATTIAYTNTTNLNSIGAAVVACTGSGLCGSPTALLTANLASPTPSNTASTSVNTTNTATTGYSTTFTTPGDIQYVRVPTANSDQVYRLQTSGSVTPAIAIVNSSGNDIIPTSSSEIQINGNTAVFKVPANAIYYVKFTGTNGSFTYGFQRYRNFPYYQGQ